MPVAQATEVKLPHVPDNISSVVLPVRLVPKLLNVTVVKGPLMAVKLYHTSSSAVPPQVAATPELDAFVTYPAVFEQFVAAVNVVAVEHSSFEGGGRG